MAKDSFETDPAQAGYRNSRGEWRSPHAVETAPIFVWPPRPIELFKWLLFYPGFLWPWHSIYLLVTLVTWFYLQPPLSNCVELKAGWIGIMFLRNLMLLWVFSGGWHLLLYILKLQGAKGKYDPRWPSVSSPSFLFRNQVYDNVFWSCVSGCTVWTAYEVFFMWAYANHWLPYVDFATHPVYFVLWLVAIPFWREIHFYWVHRLIHWKPLYKAIHYLHHKNVNPGPWSGLAMHPGEHILYFSVVLIHLVVPSHPIHLLFNAQYSALTPAGGHHGFEGPTILGGKISTDPGAYFHYLHHRYFECNYGGDMVPLDKWFGTFRNGLPDGIGSKLPSKDSPEALT